jgi:hypothetical protein
MGGECRRTSQRRWYIWSWWLRLESAQHKSMLRCGISSFPNDRSRADPGLTQ